MQKVVPNLWFDHNASEAVEFYLSVFENSKVISQMNYPKTEEEGLADFQKEFAGQVLSINFSLNSFEFVAINADDTFKPNPSISFFYTCRTKEESDTMWEKLKTGGKSLMEIGEYPFSKYYGWVQDKYGYSWQLILENLEGKTGARIMPSLLFTNEASGKAFEAMEFYTSVFPNSKIGSNVNRYTNETAPGREGEIAFADFQILGEWLAAMDGGNGHEFKFSPAVSLLVNCDDQEEINEYWEKLSATPEAEQCGWLVDKYGVSWQISPGNMEELLKKPDAFRRLLGMKKIEISEF